MSKTLKNVSVSRNHFMEGCFMFQLGGCFFGWGASLSGVVPHGSIGFNGGFSKKDVGWGRGSPLMLPPTMGNPDTPSWIG